MQIARFSIALAAAIAVSAPLAAQTSSTTTAKKVAAASPAKPVGQASAPTNMTSQQWLDRMADFTQNGSAFKDPRTFNQWFGAMTDPSIMATSIPFMMEPGNMIRTTSSMMQPGAVSNYMAFMDPGMYGRWMGAMMDPNFYMQNAFSMADPSKMMRWAMMPMDPRMMQAGMTMMDPNNYFKWMMAPADPRVWGLMFAPMNPQLYGSMAGAMMPQGNFSGPWQTFMYPRHPVVNLSPAAPVTSPINVMDPSSWGNMMGMFNGFMPAGGPLSGGMQMPAGMPFFGSGANPYLQKGATAKLALAGDALFKSGKSSLSAEGKASLDELAAKIKAAGAIDTIRVVGHADKTGKASSNMRLSQSRAAAVAAYLKKKGVKAGKIITAGKGDTQPVVNCDDKLPKAELISCLQPNRRVEIEVAVAK